MPRLPSSLLRAGALPLAFGLGLAGGLSGIAPAAASCTPRMRGAANPCAAKNPCAAHMPGMMGGATRNPCAARRRVPRQANPCAAHRPGSMMPASPCHPCGAAPMMRQDHPCGAMMRPGNPCAARRRPMHRGSTGRQGMKTNPPALKRSFATLLPTLTATYHGLGPAIGEWRHAMIVPGDGQATLCTACPGNAAGSVSLPFLPEGVRVI